MEKFEVILFKINIETTYLHDMTICLHDKRKCRGHEYIIYKAGI